MGQRSDAADLIFDTDRATAKLATAKLVAAKLVAAFPELGALAAARLTCQTWDSRQPCDKRVTAGAGRRIMGGSHAPNAATGRVLHRWSIGGFEPRERGGI